MILSHQHRFIFLKTRKTAGTAIEISLSRWCGHDDTVTPIEPAEDEAVRTELGLGPQNYQGSAMSLLSMGTARRLARGRSPDRARFWNHMTASTIRQRISESVWGDYTKFAVVRNPWDRALSQYHWRKHARRFTGTLDQFLRRSFKGDANTRIITVDGAVVADRIIVFEDLQDGLDQVLREIGLPADGWLPRVKGGARSDRRPYWEVLTSEQSELIARKSEVEIGLFGYEFGQLRPTVEPVPTSRWWREPVAPIEAG